MRRPARVHRTLRILPASVLELESIAEEQSWSWSQAARQVMALGLEAWRRGERPGRKAGGRAR